MVECFHSPSIETEYGLGCVIGNSLGKSHDISVECTANVLKVGKDECLLRVKANRNDVHGVCLGVAHDLFNGSLFGEQILFILVILVVNMTVIGSQ